MAIQLTKEINLSQFQPPPRFPNELHLSMWNRPSTRTACLICHKGCTGSCLYALLTSDFHKVSLRLGYFFRTAKSLFPKSYMVSSLTLIWFFAIVEFRECRPLLWSLTNLYFPRVLFGTALIGDECIPGSNLSKGFDQRFNFISSFDCCFMKLALSLLVVGERCPEPSYVVGRLLVSAHGQNPCLRPRITDLTKGWLGWSLRYFLRTSGLIGVMFLNRSGFWEIVLRAALFFSSFMGGFGSGGAVKVEYADTVLGRSPSRQIRVGPRCRSKSLRRATVFLRCWDNNCATIGNVSLFQDHGSIRYIPLLEPDLTATFFLCVVDLLGLTVDAWTAWGLLCIWERSKGTRNLS